MASKRVCVIGAGPSGIAAAKNAIAAGFATTVFEKNDKVGGNWVFNARTGHSSVYENTHIISSKLWSQYEDFPMPADYPDYPNHRQLQAYFESYARHFGVYEQIRFDTGVTAVAPLAGGGWQVTHVDAQGNTQQENFDAVMVANGHHWNPKYPDYEGTFDGTYLHSHDFKGVTEAWRGKRVLVVGGGNSACDVAVEAARVAGSVELSMRSPQWFMPKFMFGMPADVFAARTWWMPRKLKQKILTRLLKLLQGSYADYGLPLNPRPALSQHPTLNSDLLDFIRHGRIRPRPAIQRLESQGARFVDGSSAAFDIICVCTGFWISFPFFDPALIDFQHAEKVPLYLKMLHPLHRDLYFIGLFQPIGCIWPMADMQARLACAEIAGAYTRPTDLDAAIRHEVAHPHYDFGGGSRHSVEVDYHAFRQELKTQLARAGIDIGRPPPLRRKSAVARAAG